MRLIIGIGIGILSLISLLATASPSFRGIAPQDEALYKSAIIKCKDGSKSFTSAQLNDDFCDCLDGTDEPGTSACGEGRFHCRNAGHAAKVIFSSRVDDGICDCCDGSDESSAVRCPNSCWEQGKAARLKLRAKISTFRDGVSIRNRLVAEAKASLANDRAVLSNLQAQEKTLAALVDHLKDQKEQLDKAEEKARLLEEQQNKAKEAQNVENKDEIDNEKKDDSNKEAKNVESNTEENDKDDQPHTQEEEEDEEEKKKEEVETLETPSDNEDLTKGDDGEELSREELGRLVASRWTGENTGKQAEDDVSTAKDSEDDTPKALHEHVPDSYASETDEDHQRYDEDVADDDDDFKEEDPEDSPSSYKYESDDDSHFSDTASPSSPSLLEKLQQKVKNILKAVSLFQTPVNQSDAAHIRKEYDESSAKLSKIQSRISSLTQKLKHDFGPDKEFYSFYDTCFESKESKYVYKVCPFKHASQEEGHSSTRLGRWEKFDNSYKVMIFSNGDKCWNGPDRSLTVKLRCGLKNEVTDVDEPSRCEYVALLSTPAVCFEDKLKELEHKLEVMNKDQPEKHDEL